MFVGIPKGYSPVRTLERVLTLRGLIILVYVTEAFTLVTPDSSCANMKNTPDAASHRS